MVVRFRRSCTSKTKHNLRPGTMTPRENVAANADGSYMSLNHPERKLFFMLHAKRKLRPVITVFLRLTRSTGVCR